MAAGLTIVVDYGLCNIDSMTRALEECGATTVERTDDARRVRMADRIVLPGVGAFATGIQRLAKGGLLDAILEVITEGRVPFLGACLGMQLMATRGSEGAANGTVEGIGLVRGEVTRLVPQDDRERVPHIGWNEVETRPGSALFKGIAPNSDFYFVHSYHLKLENQADEAGRSSYCGGFSAAIETEGRPIFGTQFHPEKSQKSGFHLLKNFLAV